MTKYNHAYTIAFSLSGSTHPTGEDVTAEQLLKAIEDRVAAIRNHDITEIIECCDAPYDTYEEVGEEYIVDVIEVCSLDEVMQEPFKSPWLIQFPDATTVSCATEDDAIKLQKAIGYLKTD